MEKKIFVLDTSVIIFDHRSIMNFDEHDIVLPITVLEELDNFKKGNDNKNYEAREFIRFLDNNSKDHLIRDWIPLPGENKGSFKITLGTNGLRKLLKVYLVQILWTIDIEFMFDSSKEEPDRRFI